MNKQWLFFVQFISYCWYFVWYLILLPYFLAVLSYGLDWLFFKAINFRWQDWVLATEPVAIKNLTAMVLLLVGVSLVLAAWKALLVEAQSFPFTIISHHRFNPKKMVCTGAYGLVRHPMLLGYFFLLEGLAVYLLSPSFVLWMAPLCIWVMLEVTLLGEERTLRRWFGDEYEDYRAQVPALIPRVQGLRNLLRG